MLKALIVAHGDLSKALLQTVEKLTGPQTGVGTLSNEGCDLPELLSKIEAAAAELGPGPVVVFADLFGGSCAQATRAALLHQPDWRLVTGVNVPMLVNFFQNRELLGLDEAVSALVVRGRDGVKSFPEQGHGLAPGKTG